MPQEVEKTRKIANVRIHVERVIGSLKQKYSLLERTLPIDLVATKNENNNITTLDQIVHVVGDERHNFKFENEKTSMKINRKIYWHLHYIKWPHKNKSCTDIKTKGTWILSSKLFEQT